MVVAEGEDFLLSSTTVTFEPGGPRVIPIEIDLIDDEFFEGREELTLRLQTTQQRVLFSTETARVAIVDNEG